MKNMMLEMEFLRPRGWRQAKASERLLTEHKPAQIARDRTTLRPTDFSGSGVLQTAEEKHGGLKTAAHWFLSGSSNRQDT